jgi:hypothetical protein
MGHVMVESYRRTPGLVSTQPLLEEMSPVIGVLKDPRWTNTTKGLVPEAMIQRWFYRSAGLDLPADLPAAEVKVPHLWGYGEKRKAGLFSDGLGDGSTAGWAAMVELAVGQTPEAVRGYYSHLEELEDLLSKLLPPPFPFPIDRELAWRGQSVFGRTCSSCHGNYQTDGNGLAVFKPPQFVPWKDVGTDPQRLRVVTPEFRNLVASSPLHDLIRVGSLPPGYFAPRLDGVWARFPYLHNASVPTLRDLLTQPDRRPTIWSLTDAGEAGRFDREAIGLTVPRTAGLHQRILRYRAAYGDRDVYSTGRVGHSNQGHPFGSGLPEPDKRALLEYLKTL